MNLQTEFALNGRNYLTVNGLKKMIEGIAEIVIERREFKPAPKIVLHMSRFSSHLVEYPQPTMIYYMGVMRFETGEEFELQYTQEEILRSAKRLSRGFDLWEKYPEQMCKTHVFRRFFGLERVLELIKKCNQLIG